ncbi:RNA-binding domain, S1, IF1 type [Dillenia turbinata]|uniref:RNA-binding domain, S1, IF1 type n=1 Tax=Dillenia turbinata TaxID=194707 RepID=A0AAN8ZGU1_9MAGN
MKGGRKNLKRAVTDDDKLILQQGQTIMQVVSLRGSNHIEVMDAKGQKSLALFPSKFQKSIWIKRGGFVVVDESGREKALESGSKVACTVSQVLFHEQVRELQKSQEWSQIIKSTSIDQSNENLQRPTYPQGEEINSSDDEGLPPLEANLNRIKPLELLPDTDSESETDE